MSGGGTDAWIALAEFPCRVLGLDVSQCDERELKGALGQLRAAQRCLDGLVMRVGARLNELAVHGEAAPAAETMRGGGAVGAAQARREAARVDAAASLPGLGEAVANGEMSGEHVDALTRHTKDLDQAQRAAVDADALIEQAKHLPPETFGRLVKRTIEQVTADHGLADTVAKQAVSEFRHWFDERAGMGRFSGALDPERYEMLINAVGQHTSSLAAAGGVEKTKNLAAQALVELVVGTGSRSSRIRLPSITVVVDRETMMRGPHERSVRQTEAGHDVAAASVARLCCDAVIRQVMLDRRGVPINVGRKHRTATDGQWTAIKAMYSTCAWSNCDAPISWCQAHHIHEWEHGGPTDLCNLVPLCSRHHHRVHEGGWHIRLKPDRQVEIYKPDGTHHTTVPTPMRC